MADHSYRVPLNAALPAEFTSIAISARQLNHFFGRGELRKQVLFEINLDIYAGEVVLLTGPSGCGKTTLLTLLGGLRSVQSGSLKVLDRELAGATNTQLLHTRRQTGYIFQSHNLHGSLTVLQNVRMGLEVDGIHTSDEMEKQATRILESVGLSNHLSYYPDNLSGGQKQRVAIARALVKHPKIILADEPTAALDSQSGRNIVELIRKLAKEHSCTILMVTHDNRVLDVADRIIHMEDGKLIETNTLEISKKVFIK